MATIHANNLSNLFSNSSSYPLNLFGHYPVQKNIKNQRWETINMILGATMTIMEKKWPTEWIVETCVFNQVLFCLSDFSSRTLFRMKDLFIQVCLSRPVSFISSRLIPQCEANLQETKLQKGVFWNLRAPRNSLPSEKASKARNNGRTTKNDVCLRTQRLRSQASLSASFLAAPRNFRDIGPSGRNLSWAIPNRTGLVFMHCMKFLLWLITWLNDWLIDLLIDALTLIDCWAAI